MDDSRIVEQFRALGDPVRWAIVRELQGGTRCACVLAQVAEVSSTLLSHHLKVLREAGLITGAKRRGRWIDYTLADDALGRTRCTPGSGAGGASDEARMPMLDGSADRIGRLDGGCC